ncbi:MAG: hypothetical protein Q7J78_02670 [Clostridiales bacterium]|nr:hypothetical protein [Clostridiales bacterium]
MGEYIKKALKFYDIRFENITPVIFSAILFVSFTGVFYPEWSPETAFLIIVLNILSVFVINIVSAVYLYAAIQDLKGTPTSLSNAFKIVISKIHVILTASIVLLIMTAAGFLLLLIPGIIIYITYIFNLCYITDKNSGFLTAFRKSSKLTKGRKMELFAIVFVLNIVLGIPSAFIMLMAGSSPNPLIFNFVIAFVAAITSLMLHKLTALMYFDLEYGSSKK